MTKKKIATNPKKPLHLLGITFVLAAVVIIFATCTSSNELSNDYVTGDISIDYTQYNPPQDIASQNEDADLTELAEFAWQEFIALNWPVVSNGRGAPDTSKTFLEASKVGNTYTPVWQTYWHRNELFPAPGKIPVKPSTTDGNPPNYQYTNTYPYEGSGTGDYTLWNNLDEVNEIGEDIVFAHSTTSNIDDKYQVLYEAKMNYDGANYVYGSKLYDNNTRTALKTATKKDISKLGICDADSTKYICLPCGKKNGRQGNIEIKAGWRQLDPTKDTMANYHTQNVIYYDNEPGEGSKVTQVYKNVTMGLVGLHIIHKTETFPDFVFATWEHKDNLSSGIVYTEIQNTAFGDTAKVVKAITRVHPIPNSITNVNDMVSQYLNTQNSVWQHYKLINVQGKPKDVKTTRNVPETDTLNSAFYLSNSVIESNIELQTFTGSLADSSTNNIIYKGNKLNTGGCIGCHGNAQLAGTDFNFLILGAPFSFPEFTGTPEPGCPTGGAPMPINYWADVLNFFNLCVVQTSIGRSPHGEFWQQFGTNAADQEKNYCLFTTGNVPNVGDTRICIPKDSTNSNIILRLKGMNVEQMPGGGPYFTSAQITELAKWIQNGCPYDAAGTYSYTDDCSNGAVN